MPCSCPVLFSCPVRALCCARALFVPCSCPVLFVPRSCVVCALFCSCSCLILLLLECAQQENGVDCGYYVMRFMYDIVSCCTDVNDVEKVFNTPREEAFTTAEINAVRDKFACFFTNNYT